MEPKRFVIASGPSGARMHFAELIGQELDGILAVKAYELFKDDNYRGTHTDYRYELKLAVEHALEKPQNGMPVLYTHSLIDQLAYITLKIERYVKFESVSRATLDKELLTLGLVGAMFADSFKADHIFFLDIFEDDKTNPGRVVQDRVQMILDEWQLPYTIMNGYQDVEDWIADAVDIIKAHLSEDDGQRDTESESEQSKD